LASAEIPQIDESNLLQENSLGELSIPSGEKTFKKQHNTLFLKDLSPKQQGKKFNR
jgi:hypothetical protein